MTPEELSPDQLSVYKSMLDWATSNPSGILTCGGWAGCGKTTVLGVFAQAMEEARLLVAYVAYTGRAASILKRKLGEAGVKITSQLRRTSSDARRGWESYFARGDDIKGVPLCGTIHKLLYRPIIDERTEELKGWVKRETLDREYDLIVVDEASMVSDEILQDIARHNTPLLAVGDHGQLPPVMASGELMQNPQLRLEKIHRQAEKSPIIGFSRHIREGGDMLDFTGIDILPKREAAATLTRAYKGVNPLGVGVICWTNRMRVKLNVMARAALQVKGPPRAGEVVICLKNYPPVFNGMRGVVVADSEISKAQPWLLAADICFPDEELPSQPWQLCAPQFMREKTYSSVEELRERGIDVFNMTSAGSLFDFGYCLTAHKAQGSQFDNVVVYLDRPERPYDEEYRRWMYTSVTRASKSLTVLR